MEYVIVVAFLSSPNVLVSNPMLEQACIQMIEEVKEKTEDVKSVTCRKKSDVDSEFDEIDK
jgi:hypothetical protein